MLYRYIFSTTALITASLGYAVAQDATVPSELNPTTSPIYTSSPPAVEPPVSLKPMESLPGAGIEDRGSSKILELRGNDSIVRWKRVGAPGEPKPPAVEPLVSFKPMESLPGTGIEDRASSKSLTGRGSDSIAPPKRLGPGEPNFFDPRTGEPAIWYYKNKSGEIELFDNKGFHPSTGEKLAPITREVADIWNAQARRTPKLIDNPKQFGFFDPLTGNAKVWFRRTETGKYEFFDNPGYYPGSG
jgi:hypothetical protein